MPLKQGDLDSLCGVYSIVNAFNTLCKLDKRQREDLFKHLILELEKKERIAGAIVGGTCKWEIVLLLQVAAEYIEKTLDKQVSIVNIFKTNNGIGIQRFWKKVTNFFEQNENSTVLITMTGKYDHWACVRKITKDSMIMEDSYGISQIRKSRCRMDKNWKENYYNLTPTQTWGLTINS